MREFLKLYEEEIEDKFEYSEFQDMIQKLKDVFNQAEPVQTAAIMLCNIISKIVDNSDNQQDLIDSFQTELNHALETSENEIGEPTDDVEESPIDFSEKFDDMNDDLEDDENEDETDDGEDSDDDSEEDDGFMLDDVEKNSKNEKFQNLKKITSLKKEGKSKPKSEE